MANVIKPCPACGGTSVELYGVTGEWYFACADGSCMVDGPPRVTIEEAKAAWNALPRWSPTRELAIKPCPACGSTNIHIGFDCGNWELWCENDECGVTGPTRPTDEAVKAAWNSMPRWDSYVHENTHPDCLPEMRFRATMPQGEPRWFATRELAIRAIVEATGKEV